MTRLFHNLLMLPKNNDEPGKKEELATCEDEMPVSRRSKITRQRSLSSSSSPKKTSRGDTQLPHVFLIEFYFEGKLTKRQRKVFGNKHEAARDVQAAFDAFSEESPYVGHIRKVTLTGDKQSVHIWIDEATEASMKSFWMPFAQKFATSNGKVTQLPALQVLQRMQMDSDLRTKKEKFETMFHECNLAAVANLSETLKAELPSLKRSSDMASLVRILKGTNSSAFEKVKNKKGKTLDVVVEEEETEAALTAMHGLPDADSSCDE